MRWRDFLAVAGFVLVASCATGEDSESSSTIAPASTEPPAAAAPETTVVQTGPVEGWFQTVLDPEGSVGHAVLLAGPEDLPVVVYERRVGAEEPSVRLARCLDPACETVEHVEIPVPTDGTLGAAAVRPDGSPVVAVATGGPDIREGAAVLTLCDDPTCTERTEQQFPAVAISALAVSESDQLVAVVGAWPDPDSCQEMLSLLICGDRECDDHRLVEIGREDTGHGPTWIEFLATGSPVIAYEGFTGDAMDAEGVRLIACSDAECTDVVATETVEGTAEPVASGLPAFAFRRGSTGAVGIVQCIDEACSRAIDVEMYRSFEGGMLQPVSLPHALDDGSVAVFVYTMPSLAESDRGDESELVMFRCIGVSCDDVFVSDSLPVHGDAPIGRFLADGFAVVARSGEMMDCALEDEECQDLAEERGSLELTLCRGDGCGDELAASPVEASTVDVSEDPLVGDVVFAKNGDIWLLESGSFEAVNLTGSWEHWEGGPAWSPDGTRIAFHSDRDDPTGEHPDIYAMNADGSDVTRITDDPAGEYFPTWSPDGIQLAFSRDNSTDDHRHLVILDLESGQEFQLTDEEHNGDIASWSPDGTRIVFGRRVSGNCDFGEPCNSSIYVIDADGTNEIQLTFADGVHWFPDWSPDGNRIAFHGTRDDPLDRVDWNAYAVDADGGNLTRLTDYGGVDQSPTWSPDGSQILFQSDRSGPNLLYTMEPDGSSVAVVPGTSGASFGIDWTR